MDQFILLVLEALTWLPALLGYGFLALLALVALLILWGIAFGEKVVWDYESEGNSLACETGTIEIDLECYEKKGSFIDIRGNLKQEYRKQDIDIYLNDMHLVKIPYNENPEDGKFKRKFFRFKKPDSGDIVKVSIKGQTVYEGELLKD